ncbi:hypothetical protein CLV59_107341 [Chitinophaga dinghuensis]|uniref:Uncharacterized protein n=1 Tax=Chitinophaga dinghuensis TaxID=1539050 RepID=A0A327VT38_9BACT|nr:hypothetical protein [Chitinophaga dinghuensis]RAJ77574.1 hypothetical protein CLV59_107341 [Chitinophaga dinghuensis]
MKKNTLKHKRNLSLQRITIANLSANPLQKAQDTNWTRAQDTNWTKAQDTLWTAPGIAQ